MYADNPANWSPREALAALFRWRWFWLAPTLVCGALAGGYAAVMPRYWQASQGLVLRQEAVGNPDRRPGQFADLYEMRTLQETILELAKSQQVVQGTLTAVAAQLGDSPAAVTDEDVDEFRHHLKMLPPNGAEFGKTEVFYFLVKDKSRPRALALVTELCRQLDSRLQQLREERGRSLTAELEQQARLAEEVHDAESTELEKFESSFGADLGELRLLHSASSGQSDLRLQLVTLEAEARRYEAQVRDSGQLLELLRAAQKNPDEIIAAPSALLTSQPALRRLKDGLVDSQLATARLRGTRSDDHPRVEAAYEAEQRIRQDLHDELASAVKNAEADRSLAEDRRAAVADELADVQGRLDKIAAARAEYANRVAAVDNSRDTLNRARQKLSSARATIASAHTTSLVSPLDKAETGPHPEGPGRAMVAAAGLVGGFMLGLGVLMLTVGPTLGTGPAPLTAARSPREVEESIEREMPRERVSVTVAAPVASTSADALPDLPDLVESPEPKRAALANDNPGKPPLDREWWEDEDAPPAGAVTDCGSATLQDVEPVSGNATDEDAIENACTSEDLWVEQSQPVEAPKEFTAVAASCSLPAEPGVLPSPTGHLVSAGAEKYQGQTLEELIESLAETH